MSTIAMLLTAELAFKCCEKGMNWEATRTKICTLIGADDAPLCLPWRPIAELSEQEKRRGDEAGLLLLAPELADEDCNAHGVGMGYWQDDGRAWSMTQAECDALPDDTDLGSWMACKWSMTNDEWTHVCCTPTHYLRLTGART
jgi:hypothetical protein